MIELPVESLLKYVGFYQGGGEGVVRVQQDGNELTAHNNGQWSRLAAGSDTTFFSADDGIQINFIKSSKGEIESLTVLEEGITSAPYSRATEQAVRFDSIPFFQRGRMNDWSIKNRMVATGKDKYAVSMALKPGSYKFKLGSENFNAIDLGGSPAMQDILVGKAKTLLPVGTNLKLNIVQEGVYEFVLDVAKPMAPELLMSVKK